MNRRRPGGARAPPLRPPGRSRCRCLHAVPPEALDELVDSVIENGFAGSRTPVSKPEDGRVHRRHARDEHDRRAGLLALDGRGAGRARRRRGILMSETTRSNGASRVPSAACSRSRRSSPFAVIAGTRTKDRSTDALSSTTGHAEARPLLSGSSHSSAAVLARHEAPFLQSRVSGVISSPALVENSEPLARESVFLEVQRLEARRGPPRLGRPGLGAAGAVGAGAASGSARVGAVGDRHGRWRGSRRRLTGVDPSPPVRRNTCGRAGRRRRTAPATSPRPAAGPARAAGTAAGSALAQGPPARARRLPSRPSRARSTWARHGRARGILHLDTELPQERLPLVIALRATFGATGSA